MRIMINNSEIQSLMASRNINMFFQFSGLREARVGINSFLSIPVNISTRGNTLQLQYSSGKITGRVVNFIIGQLRGKFDSIDLDLDIPGVIGVNLASFPNANKIFNILDISDLFFKNDSLVVEGIFK